MPIEIRQLVIKGTVSGETTHNRKRRRRSTMEHESIVQDCVDQVMQIIKDNKER